MGNKIYYKGKSYGEGGGESKSITANEDEILVGDGAEWTKGSEIIAKKQSMTEDNGRPYVAYAIGATANEDIDRVRLTTKPEGSKHEGNLDLIGNAEIRFSDKAKVSISDEAKLTIAETADTAIDGSVQCYIHGSPRINIDSSNGDSNGYWTINKGYALGNQGQYNHGPNVLIHDQADVHLSGGSLLKMSGTANLQAEGNAYVRFGSILKNYHSGSSTTIDYSSPAFIVNTGYFGFGGDPSTEYENRSKRHPYFMMDGGASFIMNASDDKELDPLLICNPNGIVYFGTGSEGAKIKNGSYNPSQWDWNWPYDVSASSYFDGYKPRPKGTAIAISDCTAINISGGSDRYTYIKIAPNSTGDVIRTYITGAPFIQVSDNSHIEINNTAYIQACSDDQKNAIFRIGNNSYNTNLDEPKEIAPSQKPFVMRTVYNTGSYLIDGGKGSYNGWGSGREQLIITPGDAKDITISDLDFCTLSQSTWGQMIAGNMSNSWFDAGTKIYLYDDKYYLCLTDGTQICQVTYEDSSITLGMLISNANASKRRLILTPTKTSGSFTVTKNAAAAEPTMQLYSLGYDVNLTKSGTTYSFDLDSIFKTYGAASNVSQMAYIGLDSMSDIISTSYDGRQLVSPAYAPFDNRDLVIGLNARLTNLKVANNNFFALGYNHGIQGFSSGTPKIDFQAGISENSYSRISMASSDILLSSGSSKISVINASSIETTGSSKIKCLNGALISATDGTSISLKDGASLTMNSSSKIAMSDMAALNLDGSFKMTTTTTGTYGQTQTTTITIDGGTGEEPVSFTLAELKALKALLS